MPRTHPGKTRRPMCGVGRNSDLESGRGWAVLAALCGLALTGLAAGCGRADPSSGSTAPALRLGHFPNLTHAQALYGRATGEYAKTIAAPVEWTQFGAGPAAVEALFAGAVDAAYVGPNPAINGFIRSRGAAFVVVAGAADGGAALVVRRDSGIATDRDFHRTTVATPQLGNTQDVAARLYFTARGYTTSDRGGDLTILPLANPDQLLLMQRREIDAAWTVEPWVSRLEQEAGARIFLEERELWPGGRYPTALLVVRKTVLATRRDAVLRLVAAHVATTRRINADKDEAAPLLARELRRETGKELSATVVRAALQRLEFVWEPPAPALARCAADAARVGYLPAGADLTGLVDPGPLAEVLRRENAAPGPGRE